MNRDAEKTDRALLTRALALAAQNAERPAAALSGGPFGAVIALADGTILAEGSNQVLARHDPTAHAEMEAIRAACQARQSCHLENAVLYASSEPCPMCLAAAYWAKISRAVYANPRGAAASLGFSDARLYREIALPKTKRALPMTRLLLPDADFPLTRWKQRGLPLY
ncbi:MAG: nucleoside deaminase [Zoogloeaceae bacterium]|jgi:tRNA(Arg) A34 adenosine deaminase TadA|nr:nucleoside deaminase [Zoogloeaceae bacterium]